MDIFEEAARLIVDADYLLIASGAGFSADSGLPVYNDVTKDTFYAEKGKDYSDLADTQLLVDEPSLFWKFWGDCANSYRNHHPHNGYHILNSWCTELPKLCRQITDDEPNPFYVYSSNVDGHFRRFDRLSAYLTEIHGCVEESVCSSSIGYFIARNSVTSHNTYRYVTRERLGETFAEWNSRLSNEERDQCSQVLCRTPDIYSEPAAVVDVPMCHMCGKYPLRPCVVMFGDSCPNVIPRVWAGVDAYQQWEDAMEADLKRSLQDKASGSDGSEKKLVILELGCGLKVPSVRIEVEEVLQDINAAAISADIDMDGHRMSANAVLIRINLYDAGIDERVKNCSLESLSIPLGCRDALEKINEKIEHIIAITDAKT